MRTTRLLQRLPTRGTPPAKGRAQRLLAALEDTVKPHLPAWQPVVSSPRARAEAEEPEESLNLLGRPSRQSAFASATTHIDSILSNPLFIKGKDDESLPPHIRVLRPWVSKFEHQIYKGTATLNEAIKLQGDVRRHIKKWSQAERREALARLEVASTVWRWLCSSRVHLTPSALQYLSMTLAEGLAVEGKTIPLLVEITSSLKHPYVFPSSTNKPQVVDITDEAFLGRLIRGLLCYELQHGTPSSYVIKLFLNTLEEFDALNPGVLPNGSGPGQNNIFTLSGWLLTGMIVAPRDHVSVGLFDNWAQTLAKWSAATGLLEAMMILHHPVNSDVSAAYERLRRAWSNEGLQTDSIREQSVFAWFAADLAERLLQESKHTEAAWVLNIARPLVYSAATSGLLGSTKERDDGNERDLHVDPSLLSKMVFG